MSKAFIGLVKVAYCTPGGYSHENGIRVRVALKTPFSRPPDRSLGLRPPFQKFSVSQDPKHSPEIIIFFKICISAPQNRGKVQFLRLKFGQILVPRASNWTKNWLRPQIWWQSVPSGGGGRRLWHPLAPPPKKNGQNKPFAANFLFLPPQNRILAPQYPNGPLGRTVIPK